MWRRFRKNKMGLVGLAVVVAFTLVAIFAPVIAPRSPVAQDLMRALEPPSSDYWFGTDELGRDVFSRIVHGARLSMTIGLVVVACGGVIGISMGLISGFFGRFIDNALMRVVDILMAFPSVLLALIVVGILGPGLYNVMIAVAIAVVPRFARITRASVLAVKEFEFVTAARATGALNLRLLRKHVLPNSVAPVIVQGTLLIANAILTASSLSFLGLGPKPPAPEWGVMLSEARNLMHTAPHTLFFPGVAIFAVVSAFNLLGDGFRDALDVRMHGAR